MSTTINSGLNQDLEQSNTLFVPLLGQSNAQFLSTFYGQYTPTPPVSDESGATGLKNTLGNLTGYPVQTSDTPETNFAIGGSQANGDGYYSEEALTWWYPEQYRPGGALLQAEQNLSNWLSVKGAEGSDEIAIVWGQGESDVGNIGPGDEAAKQQYKQSTLAIFDYLKSKLNYADVKFYIMETGRLQEDGAANAGLSAQDIDVIRNGVSVVRDVQEEIALERDDVLLATDYADLDLVYEEGLRYGESYDQPESEWSIDMWHLGHDGSKVNGIRLGEYIALDRGSNHVLKFTDSYGGNAESISLPRSGLLDINIQETSTLDLIQGTDAPDVIVGTRTADKIVGGGGDDVILASQGMDTITGNMGSDVYFFDPSVYSDLSSHQDRILDFEFGEAGDKLDVYELLKLSGYNGSNAIADGYISIKPLSENSLELRFDFDGAVGVQSPSSLAILENVDPQRFQNEVADYLIVTETEF